MKSIHLLATLTLARVATAQVQPEARVEFQGPSPIAVQPALGANVSIGTYTRVGFSAAYATRPDTTMIGDAWRADVIARLTLDPFRQQRWALSIGGGLSVRRRTYLAVIADLEGPQLAGLLPAVQVGLGGGYRAALVLRRAVRNRR